MSLTVRVTQVYQRSTTVELTDAEFDLLRNGDRAIDNTAYWALRERVQQQAALEFEKAHEFEWCSTHVEDGDGDELFVVD